jgi:hypothetical protein
MAVRIVLIIGLLLAMSAAPIDGCVAVAQTGGTELVLEDFRGATAVPEFEGYGTACLTGAPLGAPPAGEHTLGGCPATRAGAGPVPPRSGAPDGFLELTDASNDQAGAVLYEQPLPTANGLHISFQQWQYGGQSVFQGQVIPADGISFFLVDGTASLTAPGAFGGSLGYAQKIPDDNLANPFVPGVNQGYLGIGFDVLGNYFGDWEHRGNGCSQRSPAGTIFRIPAPGVNMVTVRGPGNGDDGYCWLTATTSNTGTTSPWPSTLPGLLHGPLTALPPNVTPAQAAALLAPSGRTITIDISPDPVVTISVDFNDGAGPRQVLTFSGPEPAPATFKFGFAASTGAFTDVHLIRFVNIATEIPLVEPTPTPTRVPQPPVTGGRCS